MGGTSEVADLHDGQDGVDDLGIDQEVDVDRCVVARDAGLMRDFDELFAEVNFGGGVQKRHQKDETRSALADTPAKPEDDQALVFVNDPRRSDDDVGDGDEGKPEDDRDNS